MALTLANSWSQRPTSHRMMWKSQLAESSVASKWRRRRPWPIWVELIVLISFRKAEVQCYPVPDALNPCEDVMGSQWLRTSVWAVVFLAVLGNVAVLLVLFSNWKDVTVPKFLMCHLAFADLCLGLYLLLIASIDIHSMGEYFNFAFDWQYGKNIETKPIKSEAKH